MGKPQENFFYRNLANAISILGVLPMVLLFREGGYTWLIPLIIYNNVMDDLDGVLAGKLNIRSRLGADLDNLCDAVSHVILILMVGAHFEGAVLIFSMIAAASIMIRLASRLNPDAVKGGGASTNELMRHMLLVLLLAGLFAFEPGPYLILIFVLHAITMLVPFKLKWLIRGMAKTATAVVAVNVVLVVAWLVPAVTPFIAAAFFVAYLYSLVIGGGQWLKEKRGSSR